MIAELLQDELITSKNSISATAPIRVIGIGDAGCRAATLIATEQNRSSSTAVFCIDTDSASLDRSTCNRSLLLGAASFRGFGSGSDAPAVRQATKDSRSAIKEMVLGAQYVVIMAGARGVTGSSAAPIIADVARESGARVLAVVFMPFEFERTSAHLYAADTITNLRSTCDAVLEVPVNTSSATTALAVSLEHDRRYASGFVALLSSIVTRTDSAQPCVSSFDVHSVLSNGQRAVYASSQSVGSLAPQQALGDCIGDFAKQGIHRGQLDRAFLFVESATELSVVDVTEMTINLEALAGSQVDIVTRHQKRSMLRGKVRVSVLGTIRESRRRLIFDEVLNRSTEMKNRQRMAAFI